MAAVGHADALRNPATWDWLAKAFDKAVKRPRTMSDVWREQRLGLSVGVRVGGVGRPSNGHGGGQDAPRSTNGKPQSRPLADVLRIEHEIRTRCEQDVAEAKVWVIEGGIAGAVEALQQALRRLRELS